MTLIQKLRNLSPEKRRVVEDLVDFLSLGIEDRRLVRGASRLSEKAFRRIWDNPEDAAYDRL